MRKTKNVTCETIDPLNIYIKEINRYPLLTIEEEQQLAVRLQSNDEIISAHAAKTFINANLRLVVKIAHDFRGKGLNMLDIIAEGNLGLMRAALLFRSGKGAKFSTYASLWIKQYIRRAIANQSRTIRIPAQTSLRLHKISDTENHLKSILGRIPAEDEISAFLSLSTKTVRKLRNAESHTISLNAQIKEGDDSSLSEIIADPEARSPFSLLEEQDTYELLHHAMLKLAPRERYVLEMRFYEGKTLEELRVIIGKTRERVRQIQNEGLSKLRMMLQKDITYDQRRINNV